jgi:hypothetical protein
MQSHFVITIHKIHLQNWIHRHPQTITITQSMHY